MPSRMRLLCDEEEPAQASAPKKPLTELARLHQWWAENGNLDGVDYMDATINALSWVRAHGTALSAPTELMRNYRRPPQAGYYGYLRYMVTECGTGSTQELIRIVQMAHPGWTPSRVLQYASAVPVISPRQQNTVYHPIVLAYVRVRVFEPPVRLEVWDEAVVEHCVEHNTNLVNNDRIPWSTLRQAICPPNDDYRVLRLQVDVVCRIPSREDEMVSVLFNNVFPSYNHWPGQRESENMPITYLPLDAQP